MPDATITSTASTFGTISGVFSADQSTISGTISGIVPGTLTGSVGVPGPAGPAGIGLPAGGASGQYLQKTSNADYATDWVTVNLSAFAVKANNLSDLGSISTARDNLGLGSLSTPTFAGVNVPGAGTSVANLGATSLTINQQGSGQFTIQPSQGIVFPDTSIQTTAFTGIPSAYISSVSSPLTVTTGNLSIDLSAYLTSATAASTYQTLSGMSSYLTTSAAASTYQTLAGMSDYLAKAGNLAGLADTSTARTNLGLGSLAVVNDAPSDGSQYARKNGAWDVVSAAASYISSVSSPLSVTTGNLSIDLSAYAPLASPAFTGNPTAPTATFGDNDTSIATTAFVQSALLGGTANARNLEVEVRNQSGSTIAAGSIVYISGATGNKPLITLAQANNDANSAQTIGFVKTAIANNGTGYVIVRGELENIDTSALTEGVQLYLSPTVAGSWTTTKPSAPQHLVYVGIVIRSHPTQGIILVAVQNGYELEELHDVSIGTLANNDLLAYESSTDLWKNKTYSALGLLTSADAAATYAPKASPTFTGLSTFNNIGDYAIRIPGSGTGYDMRLFDQGISIRNNLNEVILINSTGIKYPDGVTQTVAYPGSSDFLLKADNLAGLANTGTARTNLGLGTMATATAADYSTTTVANGLYYPLSSNPSSYLVAADISGKADLASPTFTGTPLSTTAAVDTNTTQIATTAYVVGQGYLKSATASSTYQTLAGMSSYLTSATAASTYFTIASAANKADLASPALTGTPTAPTATLGTNTTQIATTAFVLANAPAAPVTSVAGRTGAVVLAVADVSGAAPLASPTFTGTPSLPTGTTAVTQTAGNNTTAVATTAFVQQEVPAASTTAAGKVELATLAEIITGTDTGRVMPVSQIPVTTASPYLRSLAIANFTSVSGGAAVTANSGAQFSREAYLTGTASGRAAFALGFVGTATANPSFHTANFGQINFSDKIVLSGTTVFGITGYAGNANTCIYVTLGGYSSQTTGDMTQKGIGIKRVGGTGSSIQLIVHNGTSQTAVSTSSTPALLEAVNWTIYSDGTGNVTLYINGSQAATTSAGPTGTNTAGNSVYREQVECPSGSGATHSIHSVGGWVYIRP